MCPVPSRALISLFLALLHFCASPAETAVASLYELWQAPQPQQLLHTLERDLWATVAELERHGGPGATSDKSDEPEVEKMPKWRACINTPHKQKIFCNGCCSWHLTGKALADGVCVWKEAVDVNPCLVPLPTSASDSDNLCYKYLSWEDNKHACKGLCFYGHCGPEGIPDFEVDDDEDDEDKDGNTGTNLEKFGAS